MASENRQNLAKTVDKRAVEFGGAQSRRWSGTLVNLDSPSTRLAGEIWQLGVALEKDGRAFEEMLVMLSQVALLVRTSDSLERSCCLLVFLGKKRKFD